MSVTSLPVSSTARAILRGVATAVMPSFAGGITNRSSTKISVPAGWSTVIERQMIVVVDLPQLRRDAQVVVAVARRRVGRRPILYHSSVAAIFAEPSVLMRKPIAEPQGTASFTNAICLPL